MIKLFFSLWKTTGEYECFFIKTHHVLIYQLTVNGEGLVGEFDDLAQAHATIVLFEGLAAKLKLHYDHVHSYTWFTDKNIAYHSIFEEVAKEVAVGRHVGGVANYAYADGHVSALPAAQIEQWCSQS